MLMLSDRGERTAAAMENKLSALEQKIDELLASVDQQEKEKDGLDEKEGSGGEKAS